MGIKQRVFATETCFDLFQPANVAKVVDLKIPDIQLAVKSDVLPDLEITKVIREAVFD